MTKRSWFGMIGLVCFLLGLLIGQQVTHVQAQGAKAKEATWKYDFDMPVRQGGNNDWAKAKKVGEINMGFYAAPAYLERHGLEDVNQVVGTLNYPGLT